MFCYSITLILLQICLQAKTYSYICRTCCVWKCLIRVDVYRMKYSDMYMQKLHCGKEICNPFVRVFVALIIQYAKCLCGNLLSSVSHLSVQNFFTLSHKRHEFLAKIIGRKMCL